MIRTVTTACETEALSGEHRSHVGDHTHSALKSKRNSTETNDLSNLDLLRSVAVLLVFVSHLASSMKIRGLGDVGHFGVLLFFVHTALVLMLSMERLGLTGSRLYTVFVVRRIFRIYPLSVLAVLLAVAFRIPSAPWLNGYVWHGWPDLLSNLLLSQNITHSSSVLCVLWSLPFEVQMYVFLPFLYILCRSFPSLWTISQIWLAGVIIASVEYFVRNKTDADFLLLRYFPCFLAGVLAWRLMGTGKRQLPGALWVLVLLAIVTLYRLEDLLRVYGPNWQGILHGALRNDHSTWLPPSLDLVRDWVFCGITGLAIPLFSDVTSLWLNATTKRIAKYSYGIYVSHVPMLWLCFSLLHVGGIFASAALTVVLTTLISIALYRFIEHPAIQLGKHLSTRIVNGFAFI